MSLPVIEVKNLAHSYRVYQRGDSLREIVRDFFVRKVQQTPSILNVSFTVGAGEILGLLGANGAGKTTTLKILSGLIRAEAGSARVLGHNPFLKERSFLKQIGMVFGQKNQLSWDLPVGDSLQLMRCIYQVPRPLFNSRIKEFSQRLDFSHKLTTPVRKLSLGERMKAELICALIHMPKVLFLDEPTIGLDVVSQRAIRQFIKKMAKENGVAVILTSHYMKDVEEMADNICILQEGTVYYSGSVQKLAERMGHPYFIELKSRDHRAEDLLVQLGYERKNTYQWTLALPNGRIDEALVQIIGKIQLDSLSAFPQPLEEVLYELLNNNSAKNRPWLAIEVPS